MGVDTGSKGTMGNHKYTPVTSYIEHEKNSQVDYCIVSS